MEDFEDDRVHGGGFTVSMRLKVKKTRRDRLNSKGKGRFRKWISGREFHWGRWNWNKSHGCPGKNYPGQRLYAVFLGGIFQVVLSPDMPANKKGHLGVFGINVLSKIPEHLLRNAHTCFYRNNFLGLKVMGYQLFERREDAENWLAFNSLAL